MSFIIAAIIIGMMIWSGVELVQTIRRWEKPNKKPSNAQIKPEDVNGESYGYSLEGIIDRSTQTAENAFHHTSNSAAETAVSSGIGHAVEGALHLFHH